MAAALPPAQPAYILRGHNAQIHAAAFIRRNSRLVTGDAEGWIVVWDLASKRPVAVWKAHEGALLGVREWGTGRLITHGKDNKLIVWRFSLEDEPSLSTVLPVDTISEPRKQPWLLHLLYVNTMNFCSFAHCSLPSTDASSESEELLIAVPNILTSESVHIFHLPSLKRIHELPNPGAFKGGMIMDLNIFHHPANKHLTVISGYESGHTTVSQLQSSSWTTLYLSNPHVQPILSLDVSSSKDFYLTSSADAMIVKHPIPTSSLTFPSSTNAAGRIANTVESTPLKILNTKHAGQQGLRIRNDGQIFATAGWDGRARVYSCKSMKELAVLKWHKEGCYAVAFAVVEVKVESGPQDPKEEQESSNSALQTRKGKKIETRQDLEDEMGKDVQWGGKEVEVVGTRKATATATAMTVREERVWKARTTHWLVVGSKDGKVSLWDIY